MASRRAAVPALLAAACLAVAAPLAACTSGHTRATDPAGSGAIGLEVRRLAVPDDPWRIARALAPHLTDTARRLDGQSLARWELSGLRAVVVPRAALAALLAELNPAPRPIVTAFPQLPQWTPVHQGDNQPAAGIRLERELRRLRAGHARLLARAWLVPGPIATDAPGPPGSSMRVELLPQHVAERRTASASGYFDPPSPSPDTDRGQTFHRLQLALDLPIDHALVVLSERPERAWDRSSAEPPTAATGLPAIPTFGDVLLTPPPDAAFEGDPSAARDRPRTVLILVPRGPATFGLLPAGEP